MHIKGSCLCLKKKKREKFISCSTELYIKKILGLSIKNFQQN